MFLNHNQHATFCFVTHYEQNVQFVTAIVKWCRHFFFNVVIYGNLLKVNYYRTAASVCQLFLTSAFQTNLTCPFTNFSQFWSTTNDWRGQVNGVSGLAVTTDLLYILGNKVFFSQCLVKDQATGSQVTHHFMECQCHKISLYI